MQTALVRPDYRIYDRVLRSNLQEDEKSSFRKFFDQALEPLANVRVQDAPGGILSAIRQGSEGLLVAAAHAYAHVNLPNGCDIGGVPVDGAGGAAILAASAFMGHSELGTDARNIGQDLTLLYANRMLTDAFARQRIASGKALPPHLTPGYTAPSGDPSDPVMQAEADL